MSSPATAKVSVPCVGCKMLGRDCFPSCVFAPYFPPQDEVRFSAVHTVFGASSVANILSRIEPEHRPRAVESLVAAASARLFNPTSGIASFTDLLQIMLERIKTHVAADREKLAERVDREAAFQPFDASATPPVVRQLAEVRLAAWLDVFAKENVRRGRVERAAAAAQHSSRQQVVHRVDEAPETSWERAIIQQLVLAARKHHHPVAQRGTGLAFDGHLQPVQEETADAQKSQATVDQVAREQDAMMLQQIEASKQRSMQQQKDVMIQQATEQYRQRQNQQAPLQMAEAAKLATTGQVAGQQDLTMRSTGYDATLGYQLPQPQMAQAQQLPAAGNNNWDQYMSMIQQADAAAGLTTHQYLTTMTMMMQPAGIAGGQQHHSQAEQYAAAWKQDLMMMQQAAAHAHSMPASGSGTMITPFLPAGGSADADAFLVQQQRQPPQLLQLFPEQPCPPGGSADGDAFRIQQQPQPHLQTNLPHHQQNLPPDGDGRQ